MLAELLIDGEEDRVLRAVLVGMLRERRQGFTGTLGPRGASAARRTRRNQSVLAE